MNDHFGLDMVYHLGYFHIMFCMCASNDSCKHQHRNTWQNWERMDSSFRGFEILKINGYLILKFFKYLDSTNSLILIILEMLEIGSSLKN